MHKELLIGLVDPESDLYHQAIDLRFKELREPLGLEFTPEQLAEESDQMTIAASDGNQVIGVLMLKPLSDDLVKIRQVAVDRNVQGRGVGKEMSLYAEQFAKDCGYSKVVLNARKTAVDFYLKLGYTISSDEFTEVGIPHFEMQKTLV